MLECVVNVSEGRDPGILDALARSVRGELLDIHADPDHHRSVFTLLGDGAPRRLAEAAVELLDISEHEGVHPRLGVVDVVPFVPLENADMGAAIEARDAFARWAADELGVPCFLYGPERSLPEVRKRAWRDLPPDTGSVAHPTAGAMCVGARPVLVAYNVWLAESDLAEARRISSAVRGPHLRALGLAVGDGVQVSMNLVSPADLGPAEAFDAVASHARVARAELVGLVPMSVLTAVPENRWRELDLSEETTIEGRRRAIGR